MYPVRHEGHHEEVKTESGRESGRSGADVLLGILVGVLFTFWSKSRMHNSNQNEWIRMVNSAGVFSKGCSR